MIKKIINKLIWKNRFTHLYFMKLMKIKIFRNLLMNYFSNLDYKYRTNCFYHVREYINNYNGVIKDGVIELFFNNKKIILPYSDKGFGGAFALLFHDIEVKQTYFDLLNNDNVKVFYDVGANTGYHSIIMAAQGIKVLSFEPNNFCFNRYNKMFSVNSFEENWINKGVGDENGKLFLNYNENETYLGFLSNEKMENFNSVKVDVITLDGFSNDESLPELIKIDTEGHELKVLQGAQNIINKKKPYIIFEYLPESNNLTDLIDFFTSMNYDLISLPLNKNSILLSHSADKDKVKSNILAFHLSKKDTIDKIIYKNQN